MKRLSLAFSVIVLGFASLTVSSSSPAHDSKPPAWLNYTSPFSIFPESVVWDDIHHRFLVSSLRGGPRVFSVDPTATPRQLDVFVSELAEPTQQHHFPSNPENPSVPSAPSAAVSTLGLFIDSRGRLLAVVQNLLDPAGGAFSALAAYDLRSRTRLFLARLDGLVPGGGFTFANDVTVDEETGDAYITDSSGDNIFKVDNTGEASLFLTKNYEIERGEVLVRMEDGNTLGLNGIVGLPGKNYFLVGHSSTGRVLKVSIPRGERGKEAVVGPVVEEINFGPEPPMVWVDGLRLRADGKLVITSRAAVRLVESTDEWQSAQILEVVPQEIGMSATTVAFQEPGGHAYASYAFFPEAFGGKERTEFSLRLVQFMADKKKEGSPSLAFLSFFTQKRVFPVDGVATIGVCLLAAIILLIWLGGWKKGGKSIKAD